MLSVSLQDEFVTPLARWYGATSDSVTIISFIVGGFFDGDDSY